MSSYKKILTQFVKIGLSENTVINNYDIKIAIDRISYQNGGPQEFDKDIAQQLWQYTSKNNRNMVILRDYIQSIIEAQNILKNQLDNTEKQILSVKDSNYKQELQNNLVSYAQDHKLLTLIFKMDSIDQTYILHKSRSNVSKNKYFTNEISLLFTDQPAKKEKSYSLMITFGICLITICLQMFVMFHKHHFYNLLILLAVLALFILNYFDKIYINFCLFNLTLSIILDLIWMIVYAKQYWSVNPQTQHSTIQTGYLIIVTFIIVIMMFLKILMIILLFRYRNNLPEIKKIVDLGKIRFFLNGSSQNNPVSFLIQSCKIPHLN